MLCVVLICTEGIVVNSDGCLTSSILFKYERSRGHLFVLSWPRYDGLLGGVLFRSDVL